MRSGYWIRNDIRMNDNKALFEFCKDSSKGFIFWCPDKNFHLLSVFKKQSIMQALGCLNQKLLTKNQEIIVFNESINQIFPLLINDLKIEKVYYTKEHAFHEKEDEEKVAQLAKEHGLQIKSFDQATLIAEKNLPFLLEDMPFVFTQFRKKVEDSLLIDPPLAIPQKFPEKILLSPHLQGVSNPILDLENHGSSEDDLLKRLNYYFWENESVLTYKDTRNGLLGKDDSTRFSIGLNVGSVSARTIYSELKKFEKDVKANESTYWVLFELLWRDYFKFFSAKYGNKIFLRDGLKSNGTVKYKSSGQDRAQFLSWCEGSTESRFINANMNELNQTGWMSNRGRQNVASYLIHQLRCPWTWGAAYFQRKLIDYDPDLNWGNWLYLSGEGSDPRSRVFNVDRQISMYDPEGSYQNKWSPPF
jgi:deoxyribodipyrimidine photo-lyase